MEDTVTPLADIANKFNLPERICYQRILDFGNKLNFKVIADDNSRTFVHGALVAALHAEHDRAQDMIIKRSDIKPSCLTPVKGSTYIYFLLFHDNIEYIGQTCNLSGRLAQHRQEKCFDGVFFAPIKSYDIDLSEGVNIMFYNPPLNRIAWGKDSYFKRILNNCDTGYF